MNVPKDTKRQEIKDRIAASQARNSSKSHQQAGGGPSTMDRFGEKAIEAKDGFTSFAREHPVAVVAGGLALGVLIAGMFKGPRRAAAAGGAKAAGLAALAAEFAAAYTSHAVDAAGRAGRVGADKLDDLGDGIGDAARTLRREANYRVGGATDSARTLARDVSKTIVRGLRRP